MSKKEKLGFNLDEDLAMESDATNSFDGAFEVEIIEAITGFWNSGAQWVDLKIEIPSKGLNSKGEPKQYNLERMTITSGDTKGNQPTFQMNIFQTIFFLTKTKPTVAKAVGLVWEDSVQVEKKVDQFKEILGKKIGAVCVLRQRYRNKPINGYTKESLEWSEARQNPIAVYVPAYKNDKGEKIDPRPNFVVKRWFISKKGKNFKKTFSEIKENKSAEIIDKIESNLKPHEAHVMDTTEMNEYIKTQLKKKLTKAGEEFDESKWEPIVDAVEDEDVPF